MEGIASAKKSSALITGLVVIVVIVVVSVLFFGTQQKKSLNLYPKVTAPKLVATAPAGKLVEGMPGDLIYVNDAVITKSEAYTTTSPSGDKVNLYLTTYKTAAELKSLYSNYERYATSHKDTFINGGLKSPVSILSFQNRTVPSMIYRITITDNGGKDREVSILINKQ